MKKAKIYYNKKYTMWCGNGHSVKQMVEKLRYKAEHEASGLRPGQKTSVDVPNCPICGSGLYEGVIS